ncbi:MAG: TonB-dependent receptor [Dokdonella sp.]|nr:TonB-dependent receptor [Dokdonella sp.]
MTSAPLVANRRSRRFPGCPPKRLALCAALAAVLGTAGAQAQTAPAQADDGTVYLSPLVTQADETDPYAEPAADSAISADAIDLFGGQNLDDVLRSTAGTFTRDNPQNPGVAVNIRGLEGSGRVNMTIDGIRQNFRFAGHEAQGFTYVDPALLAGIDVSRGAVSGVGGAGALAGSVNFRTLGADDILGGGRDAGGFAALNWGDNGSGFAPVAAGAARWGAISLAAAVSRRSPDDYDNGDGVEVPGTAQDLTSGLIKFEYRPSETHRLSLGGLYYDNDFLANSYNQNIDSRQYTAGYAYTPGTDWVNLRVNAYRSDVTMTYDDAPGIPTGGTAMGRVIEDVGTGFDVSNTSRLGSNLTTTYGVEYFDDDVDVVNSAAVPDRGVNPSGESSIGGVFADTRLSVGITDVIVGLRYDRFTLKGHGSVTAGNPLGMPEGPYTVDRSDGRFNPKLTLALNPADWVQPYVSWSKTFRPPTISETMTGGSHPASGGPPQSFFPNPFLKPETSRGWEAGANFLAGPALTADDSLRVKLGYFHNRVEDYITAVMGQGVYFGNNPGTSTVKGVELEGGYDAGFVFANLSYTHTDSDLPAQVNGFGAQSYVPDDVVSATIGTRLLERRLTLGTRYYKVSRSFIGDINAYDGDPWDPGYHLVDLFANYVFGNGTELRANVSNLLDEAYTPVLSTPAGGSEIDTGRGRTVSLTAKFRF